MFAILKTGSIIIENVFPTVSEVKQRLIPALIATRAERLDVYVCMYVCMYIYIYTRFQKRFHPEKYINRYMPWFTCTCTRVRAPAIIV